MTRFEQGRTREGGYAAKEWVFKYEWFAGWRWEHHRNRLLMDECLESYETLEMCVANARAQGYQAASTARLGGGPQPKVRIAGDTLQSLETRTFQPSAEAA